MIFPIFLGKRNNPPFDHVKRLKFFMNKFSVILLVLVLTTSLSCSKKPLFQSKKLEQASERYEPGSMEWTDKLHYDSENRVSYGCFNDDRYLMIRVKVTDRDVLRKIFATGFTIWIDTTARKNPQFGVKYPLPQGLQTNQRSTKDYIPIDADLQKKKPPQQDMQNMFLTALNNIEMVGFSNEAVKNARLNVREGEAITAWIHFDEESAMYYELKIPFSEISPEGQPTERLISIGLQSGKTEMPTGGFSSGRPSNGGGPGGRPGEGQGQPGGMQRGDGDSPPQMGASQSMSQPIEIWMKRIELQKTN